MTKKFGMLLIPLSLVTISVIWSSLSASSLAQTNSTQRSVEDRVDKTVREVGILEGVNSIEVVNRVPGSSTLLWIIADGTYVKKGDLLAELDNSKFEEQIQQHQVLAIQSEAARREAETLMKQSLLEQKIVLRDANDKLHESQRLREQIENLTGEYGQKQKTVGRELKLFKEKLTLVENRLEDSSQSPQEKLHNQITQLDFQSQIENLQSSLEQLTSTTIPLQREHRKSQVEAAEQNRELKQLQSQAHVDRATGVINASKIEERFVHERLQRLENSHNNCRVLAPRDGFVIHPVVAGRRATSDPLEEGALVKERQMLLTMPDLKSWQVRVSVHETKIARVEVGQSVTLMFDSFPESKFMGKVISVSSIAQSGAWPNYDKKNYDVIVSFPQSNDALKLGMTCLAEIGITD